MTDKKQYLDLEALREKAAEWDGVEEEHDSASFLTSEPPPIPEGLKTPYTEAFIEWDGFFSRDFMSNDWLVEPFLARGRSHALVAEAKTGKSLMGLDIGLALATGRPIFDNPAAPPMHVLYVDHEMTDVDVWERASSFGYGPSDEPNLRKFFHYSLLPSSAPTDTERGGVELAMTATICQAELVIIDTFSRAVEGKEQDNSTAQDYYRHTGKLLKEGGITVLRLDHHGKDVSRGGRGGSAKNDDVDVVYSLTKSGTPNQFTLQATHTRMGWVPKEQVLIRDEEPLRHSLKGDVAAKEHKIQQVIEYATRSGYHTNTALRQYLRSKDLKYSNAVIAEAVRRLKGEAPE